MPATLRKINVSLVLKHITLCFRNYIENLSSASTCRVIPNDEAEGYCKSKTPFEKSAKHKKRTKEKGNLEMKLEATRRELEEAQALVLETPIAPIIRKTFTFGEPSSIPSKNLLRDHVNDIGVANKQSIASAKDVPDINLRSNSHA